MSDQPEPVYRSPSYRPCRYCRAECTFGTEGEPCWGEVKVTSDYGDPESIHTCEGHCCMTYLPEPAGKEIHNG